MQMNLSFREATKTPISTWQLKYNRNNVEDNQGDPNEDDKSVAEWIANAKAKAESLHEIQDTQDDGQLFDCALLCPKIEQFDSEVAEVIQQMEAILATDTRNTDLFIRPSNDDEARSTYDSLAIELLDADITPSTIGTEALTLLIDREFNTEQIVALFLKSRQEKIARRCLRILSMHCKREKKRLSRAIQIVHTRRQGAILGRSFLSWKSHRRMMKVKETALVLKFGRCASKRFRQAFLEWKKIATSQSAFESQVFNQFRHKTLQRSFFGWLKVSRLANEDLTISIVFKTKSRIFSAWQRTANKMKAQRDDWTRKRELAHQAHSTRLLRTYLTLWLFASRNKTPKNPADRQPASEDITAKENQRPNVSLLPLNQKKKAPSFNSPTPKLIKQMEARRIQRNKNREILKAKQEEKLRLRKEKDDANRRLKEEQELQLQNAYLRQRAQEEKRKQMEVAQRKKALRLANLHYKMSLCKRIFKQWFNIFQVLAFNERKAHLAWCDVAQEKCFNALRDFKDDEKRRRLANTIRCVRLAENFNAQRLLAKSFAAWEEQASHTKSLMEVADQKYCRKHQHSVLLAWHVMTTKAVTERDSKETYAEHFGSRLCLRTALQQWRSGVTVCQKEREIEELVDAKRIEVYSWLGEL